MTPKEMLYNGVAKAVSSKNTEGKFDIIPMHANFITIVENQPIIVLTDKNQKITYNFSQAIIYNLNDQVSVFAEPLSVKI